MAYDNNFVQEDVLFGGNQDSSQEEAKTAEVESYVNEDLGEEVLFGSSSDDVRGYIEEFVFDDEEPAEEEVVVQDQEVEEDTNNVVAEEETAQEVDNSETVVSDELTKLAKDEEVAVAKPVYIEKNFAQKFLEADEEILKRYDELKNVILKYKGVKSRVSNDFDSFNMGRTQLFKLGFSTQSLKLYLNLDYSQVETRLKCKDVSHKKAYAQVPVFLRIKSPRAMRNAKYLINQVAEKFELKENPKATKVDSIEILKSKAKTYNKD